MRPPSNVIRRKIMINRGLQSALWFCLDSSTALLDPCCPGSARL